MRSLRKIRILFTGVTEFPTFLKVLECMHELGEPQQHYFNYQEAGHGEFILHTRHSNKKIEQSLESALPSMFTGIETLEEESHARRAI